MITLSSVIGCIIFNDSIDEDLSTIEPRVSRVQTLDGGVVVTHSGFCHGDRTFAFSAEVSVDDYDLLSEIVQNETEVLLSCREGVFNGVVSRINYDGIKADITFMVKEKLT